MAVVVTIPLMFQLGTCLLLWNIPPQSPLLNCLLFPQWQSLNFNIKIE